VGALAAAFAGAFGAHWIAKREKHRDDLLGEIRHTNAAIMVTFSICNSLISMKKQHVKKLKEDWEGQKESLLDHKEKIKLQQISRDTPFHFLADLETLSLSQLPVDILQNQVLEKLSLVKRPLLLTTTLSQAIHSLAMSLEQRNQLIESYKRSDPAITPALYFGLPYDGDNLNQVYPSLVDATYKQTDDGIFFSQLLCKDLVEHGEKTADQFKKKFGKGSPRISKPNFDNAEKSGLMPEKDNYLDWITMFVNKDDSSNPTIQ